MIALIAAASLTYCAPLIATDGDTLKDSCGTRYRIASVNACETHAHEKDPRCDRAQAQHSKADLARRIAAGRVTIEHFDANLCRAGFQAADRYGRPVVRVIVNGRDVGADMISAGTARVWSCGR